MACATFIEPSGNDRTICKGCGEPHRDHAHRPQWGWSSESTWICCANGCFREENRDSPDPVHLASGRPE